MRPGIFRIRRRNRPRQVAGQLSLPFRPSRTRVGPIGWIARYRDPARPHTRRESLRYSAAVVTAVVAAVWFTGWPLPRWAEGNPDVATLVVEPIVWLIVAALALYGWLRLADRPPPNALLAGLGLLAGLLHGTVLVVAGVVAVFGDNAIPDGAAGYARDLLSIVTLLAGAETARAFVLHAWRRFSPRASFAAVAVGFAAAALAAEQWAPLTDSGLLTEIGVGEWVPALALSAAATAMAQIGGPVPAAAYRFVVLGFAAFSPLVPILRWPAAAIVGTLAPLLAWQLLRSAYAHSAQGKQRAGAKELEPWEEPGDPWLAWLIGGLAAVAAVALVVFASGIVGYRLVVIDGDAMEPEYRRGDVAIVRDEPDLETLAVDDVIGFHRDDRVLIGRVVAIEEGSGGALITIRSDDPAAPRATITTDEIEGAAVLRIPGLGHISLWMRKD